LGPHSQEAAAEIRFRTSEKVNANFKPSMNGTDVRFGKGLAGDQGRIGGRQRRQHRVRNKLAHRIVAKERREQARHRRRRLRLMRGIGRHALRDRHSGALAKRANPESRRMRDIVLGWIPGPALRAVPE
jgi:hypothetical protein